MTDWKEHIKKALERAGLSEQNKEKVEAREVKVEKQGQLKE